MHLQGIVAAVAPTRSLWLQEALAAPGEEEAPVLEGRRRADVCVVGGGYTGLWTALRVKELDPSVDVVVVEGDVCGAGYHEGGCLWAATNASRVGAWDPVIATLAEHGEHPFEVLSPGSAARRAGSPVHLAGAFERTGAIVQPARLARGLRRVAIERGVRVFERSPMRRLHAGSVE